MSHVRIPQNGSISIHALREEGDLRLIVEPDQTEENFYPRPPRGGRRLGWLKVAQSIIISIHALREEGDLMSSMSA